MVAIKNHVYLGSPCFSIPSTGPYFRKEIAQRKLKQDVTKKTTLASYQCNLVTFFVITV